MSASSQPPAPVDPEAAVDPALPLFPLQAVLFPGGLLHLRVFEARYLDMVSRCLRSGQPFGVVCLQQGGEVQRTSNDATRLETVGTLAHIDAVDAEQAGILQLRCRGGVRFSLQDPRQASDGLWLAHAQSWTKEAITPVDEALQPARDALRRAVDTLHTKGETPFLSPYRYDDAGWIANRWCELLSITLAARQRLMALDDPRLRLQLVQDYLIEKGIVSRG
ncbi:MAG: hypothetical protein RLY78_2577 [Pseudomonadota bacterium]